MSTTKQKTLYYRRAKWASSQQKTLEAILIEAHQNYSKADDRTFGTDLGTKIQGVKSSVDNPEYYNQDGLYLQVGLFREGGETSVITKGSMPNIVPQAPTPESEFVEGQNFAYIKDNHVILCPSNANAKLIETYILRMLAKMNSPQDFELSKIANVDPLELIHKEGIQEIRLNISIYEASLRHIERKNSENNSTGSKILKIQKFFATLFAKDEGRQALKENEDLMIQLAIKQPKEPKGVLGSTSAKKDLQDLVSEIYEMNEENDAVEFITTKKTTIKSSELNMSKKIQIKREGNSVCQKEAWQKLKDYFDELKTNGVLEQ